MELLNVAGVFVDTADGTYSIAGVLPGTYYLKSNNENSVNFVNEWWASTNSCWDCNAAQAITVNGGQTYAGNDFQLDPGATISGIVYQSDNGTTPMTGGCIPITLVPANRVEHNYTVADTISNPADGTYTIIGVPPGTFHLKIRGLGLELCR